MVSVTLISFFLIILQFSSANSGSITENEKHELMQSLQVAPKNENLTLYLYYDRLYTKVTVGNPGKPFNLAVDTSWYYSFLMSSSCDPRKFPACVQGKHHLYDHRGSSSYENDTSDYTVQPAMVGYRSKDTFKLPHVNVSGVPFFEMTEVPNDYENEIIDGIIGLGLYDGSEPASYIPFFDNLLNQKGIEDPVFTIYVNRHPESRRGGTITFGVVNSKHQRIIPNTTKRMDFTYLSASTSRWEFDVNQVFLTYQQNNKQIREDFCLNTCTAFISVSSLSIIGPKPNIDLIHQYMGAVPFDDYIFPNRFRVDCSKRARLPILTFQFGEKNFSFHAKNYLIEIDYLGETTCLSAFESFDAAETWVLGGAFLREVYTVFDRKKQLVGLVDMA